MIGDLSRKLKEHNTIFKIIMKIISFEVFENYRLKNV